jgi:hypothetical protein
MAISSAEDALTVLPENLEAAIPVGGKSRRRVQRGNSTEPSYRCDAFDDVGRIDPRLALGFGGRAFEWCDIKVFLNIVWRGAQLPNVDHSALPCIFGAEHKTARRPAQWVKHPPNDQSSLGGV